MARTETDFRLAYPKRDGANLRLPGVVSVAPILFPTSMTGVWLPLAMVWPKICPAVTVVCLFVAARTPLRPAVIAMTRNAARPRAAPGAAPFRRMGRVA